jgi:hypothetical protein
MSTTPEEILQSKLESIKESIIGFKFVTDSLLDRADKSDLEMANCRSQINKIDSNGIRIDERIANIERYIDAMRGDIRAVRNSVVGAIIVASIVGLSGLAITGLSIRTYNNTPAIAGRTA